MSLSSSSSGSSSSSYVLAVELQNVAINQNNHDLLPFSWIAEQGVATDLGDNSKIGFTIEASNSSYMNYTAIIDRNNGAITSTPSGSSSVYVPQDNDTKYEHRKVFYVDVIAKDKSGIREVRTHVEPNKYEFEQANSASEIFNVPLFTWSN